MMSALHKLDASAGRSVGRKVFATAQRAAVQQMMQKLEANKRAVGEKTRKLEEMQALQHNTQMRVLDNIEASVTGCAGVAIAACANDARILLALVPLVLMPVFFSNGGKKS